MSDLLAPTFIRKLDEVDDVMHRAVVSGDPFIAANYGLELWQSVKLKGLALAKLLYLMNKNWELFQAAGIEEEFEDFVDANIGLTLQTVRKYTRMWGAIFENEYVSEDTKKLLYLNPIKKLLLLSTAVEEGSLAGEELKAVALMDDYDARKAVKEVRGDQTSSKSAIHILLQVLDGRRYPAGTLIAEQDSEHEVIGSLVLKPETPFGQKAIARIRNSNGLVERR